VHDQRFSPTVVVGAITAAATAGALVAIGHRMGDPGGPFIAIARAIARRSAPGGGVVLGVVLHVIATFVWSAVCVRIAERVGSKAAAALAAGVANFFVSSLVAWWTGHGLASELTLGDRVLYAVVLTASLIVGMRYAFLHPRETATS
jgi:hypothetical protein